MNPHAKFQLLLAVIGSLSVLGGIVWRLATSISEVRHKAELNRQGIDALDDKIELAVNGLKERLDHAKTRQQADIDDHEKRIDRLESFLTKYSKFEK